MQNTLIRNVVYAALFLSLTFASRGQTQLFAPNNGAVGSSTTTNVGVGTASPSAKLDVNAGSTTGLMITTANQGPWGLIVRNASYTGGSFGLYQADDGWTWLYGGYPSGARLAMGPNGNIGLNVSGGNVGIGTNAPLAALDVIKPGNVNVYENGIRANRPDAQGQFAFMGYGQSSADAYFGSVYTGDPGVYGSIHFRQYTQGMTFRDALNIDSAGNVGIGTTNPTQKLSVNGTVRAKEIIVDTGWPDYVFDKSYKLSALSDVERHIKTERHLPGIPSAAEVAANGISVGEMQAKLLQKIEELTLHQIEQEKEIARLNARLALVEKQ